MRMYKKTSSHYSCSFYKKKKIFIFSLLTYWILDIGYMNIIIVWASIKSIL